MRHSVYGLSYEDACKMIDNMKQSGVDANITQGGIAIYPDGTMQFDKMNQICARYGTKAKWGGTPFEEDIMHRKR